MVTAQKFQTEVENLRQEIHSGLVELQNQQTKMMNNFKREMKMVKSLLLDISGQNRPVGGPPGSGGHGSFGGAPELGGQGLFGAAPGRLSSQEAMLPGSYESPSSSV